MKIRFTILAIAGALSFWGCQKDASRPEIEAAFNQQFTFDYVQRVNLPTQSTPELRLDIENIIDSRCPPNLACLLAGNVQTTIGIIEQTGARQTAKLCLGCGLTAGPTDSAVVQANSRRYVLRLHIVTPVAGANKDAYQVTMSVKR
jgi:hypothetical protein